MSARKRYLTGALAAGGMLVLVLWLTADLTVPPRYLPHDSLLFVNWATSLREGKWLGEYTLATLSKLPGYGFWLFILGEFGWRVIVAEQILHWAAAVFLTLFLWRRGLQPPLSFLFLFMMTLSPEAFSSSAYSLSRDFLYDTMTLFLIGCCCTTIYARRLRSFLPCTLVLSILACCYALLREESAWFLPTYALFLSLYAHRHYRATRRLFSAALRVGLLVLLPAFAIGSSFIWLAGRNTAHYGAPGPAAGTTGGTAFSRLHAVLAGIETGEERMPHVPVSRTALRKAFAASPAFSELQPDLERMIARITSNEGAFLFVEYDTLAASSLYWGIASAAAGRGHFASAAASNAYFRRITDELEAACRSGALSCRTPPTYTLPTMTGAFARGAAIVAMRTLVPDFLQHDEEYIPLHLGMLPFFAHVTGDHHPPAAYQEFAQQTDFDANYYIRTYPDATANPWEQYAVYGVYENRSVNGSGDPPFDPLRYIQERPHLRNAAATPLQLHLALDRERSVRFTYGEGGRRGALRRGLGALLLLYSPFFIWGIRRMVRTRAALEEPQQSLECLMLLTLSAIAVRALLLTYIYGFVFDNRDALRYMMPLYGLYVCFCAAAIVRRCSTRPLLS